MPASRRSSSTRSSGRGCGRPGGCDGWSGFVDAAHFVHGAFLGYLWCFVRLLVREPSGRKRLNVLGAIDAVTHELTMVVNDTVIDAMAAGELRRKLLARYAGRPVTLVLDNARYQKCEVVRLLAAELKTALCAIFSTVEPRFFP